MSCQRLPLDFFAQYFSTSASEDFWFTLSFSCWVANSCERIRKHPEQFCGYSLMNNDNVVLAGSSLFCRGGQCLVECFVRLVVHANALMTSGTDTSMTFIPPFKSKPKLISISRHCFSVQLPNHTFSFDRMIEVVISIAFCELFSLMGVMAGHKREGR